MSRRTSAAERVVYREARAAVLEILAGAATLAEAAPRVLRALGEPLGWDAGALWVGEPSGNRLRCIATWSRHGWRARTLEISARRRTVDRGIGLAGRILETKAPLWIADLSARRELLDNRLGRSEGLRAALGVPVRQRNRVLGILEFYGNRPRDRDGALMDFVAAIGSHIGSFVQRERSRTARADRFARIQRRRSTEDEILNAIAASIVGETDLVRVLALTLTPLQRLIPFTGGSLMLREGNELIVQAAFGLHAERVGSLAPRDFDLVWQVVETDHPFHTGDLVAEGVQPARPIRSMLAVPVRWRGAVFGILEVDSVEPHVIETTALPLIQRVAGMLSGSIEVSKRHTAEVQATRDAGAARRQLALLAEVSRLLATSLDLDATVSSIAKLAVPALADWCSIDIVEDGAVLRQTFHSDPDKVTLARELEARFPTHAGPALGTFNVIRTGTSELYAEIPAAMLADKTGGPDRLEILRRLRLCSAMVVPFVTRGRILGALTLVSAEDGRHYGTDDLAFAEELARRAALAIDNALLHQAEQSARRSAEEARDRIARLQAITSALSRAVTVSEIGDAIVEQGMRALGAMAGSMSVLAPGGSELTLVRERGYPAELTQGWQRVLLSTSTEAADAVKSGEPVVLASTGAVVVRYPQLTKIWDTLRGGPHVAIPLIAARRPLGVLVFTFPRERELTAEDQALLLSIAQQCAQALERARLYEREHRVAETLQRAFLPAGLPVLPGVVIQAAYVPSAAESEIGGDWYDVFMLPDGRIAMSVGDVVGRGLQAAVIMGQIRQTIRAAALESHAPSMVLDRAGGVLRLTYEAEGMATAIFGIFNPVSLTFEYSSAGHPAPLLAHSDVRVEPLASGGLPLGVHTPNVPPAWTVSLPRGSLLVLYTDGMVESTRNLLEGERALLAAVGAEAGQPSADAAGAILTRTIPGGRPSDDVAIITLRISAAESKLNLSVRATPGAARTLRLAMQQFLGQHRIDPARASDIQVAVGEAVNNVIEHAYGAAAGPMHLSGWFDGSTLVVEIRDHGRWRPEREERRGHGVKIMRALADRVDLNTTPTGTVVRLALAAAPPPSGVGLSSG